MNFVQKAIDIFSVTMFCAECEAEGLPNDKSLVAVHGGTSDKPYVKQVDTTKGTVAGFTPHMVFVISKKGPVTLHKVCGIVGCGVHVYEPEDKDKALVIQRIEGVEEEMTLKAFNSLRTFKDRSYHV